VDPEDLVDERTDPAHLFVYSRSSPDVEAAPSMVGVTVPTLSTRVIPGELTVPAPQVWGYDYAAADQAYHVEVWIEKSTMNDVLLPLCQRYHANLLAGAGTMSITSVVDLAKRAAQHAAAGKRGTRIFYISDFDRAGDAMPRQVSRQAEFWLERYARGVDIRLLPLMLTREQIDHYNLPNVPGESAEHNNAFEHRQGRGVVELDALEALFPGETGRIVGKRLTAYVDPDLAHRLLEAEEEAETIATRLWAEQTEQQRAELATIAAETAPIVARFQAQLSELARQLAEEVQPYRERLDAIEEAISAAADDFNPELPERPEAATVDDADEPWLYDSQRDFLEQLRWYQRHKAGTDEEVVP
jgi:hypothetical protein